MAAFTPVLTDRGTLTLAECQATFSAAPVAASLNVKNGSNGDITVTSVRGEDIGNATSLTFTMTTNAASVTLSGYDIGVILHKDGTNAFSDTTASNVKTLLEANSNIMQLIEVTTNTAGIMATATKALLTGGGDKITISNTRPELTLTRDYKGLYDLTFTPDNLKLTDYAGALMADMSADSVTSGSGVCRIEVVQDASNDAKFRLKMFDYAGAATDVAAASKLHVVLAGTR